MGVTKIVFEFWTLKAKVGDVYNEFCFYHGNLLRQENDAKGYYVYLSFGLLWLVRKMEKRGRPLIHQWTTEKMLRIVVNRLINTNTFMPIEGICCSVRHTCVSRDEAICKICMAPGSGQVTWRRRVEDKMVEMNLNSGNFLFTKWKDVYQKRVLISAISLLNLSSASCLYEALLTITTLSVATIVNNKTK